MNCTDTCGETRCPICGDVTGMRIDGTPFCVYCESQRLYWGANLLHESPGISASWQRFWDVVVCTIAFTALCGAAVYMLWKW